MSTPLKKKLCRDWRLYVITDPASAANSLESQVEKAILGGAGVVQLRDKNKSDEELLKLAQRILLVARRHQVPLIINDRVSVARDAQADGLHLGQEDGPLAAARAILGADKIIGRSTHSPEQALAAEKEGFDYIGVGPVFSTPTKPAYAPVGLELVRFASENITIPFVVIGGIDLSNVTEVLKAGAKTVAVVRAVMGSQDPETTARQFIEKMTARSIG